MDSNSPLYMEPPFSGHWINIIKHQWPKSIAESPGSHEAAWALNRTAAPEVREKKMVREPTLKSFHWESFPVLTKSLLEAF